MGDYNFRWSHESYFMLESLLVVADGFQRPWFSCLFDRENSEYRIVSTQGVLNIVSNHGGLSW